MKALTFAMRSFGRELRSGEVVVLLSAVILAVAAPVRAQISFGRSVAVGDGDEEARDAVPGFRRLGVVEAVGEHQQQIAPHNLSRAGANRLHHPNLAHLL